MRKKGITSLVVVGLLASSLSVGTVKAEGNQNQFELSKKAIESHIEKPLQKGVVDSKVLNNLEKEIESSKSAKDPNEMSFMSSSDYIFEQEYNDDFNSANATSYEKPTIGQLLPYYDFDFHKVTVPSDGVLVVGGDTNSYAIDLLFLATEKDWNYSGKLEYLGTEYEDGIEFQAYQAKKGTYYIPVLDQDNEYYDDNTEDDLYAIATAFADNVAPSKPTVNKVDNNDKVVKGKAEANSTVTVKARGKVIGTAKATSKGDFSATIAVQKADSKLYVNAKDGAGNVSSSTSVTVADVVAPSKPKVNKVDSNDKKVTGTAEVNSTVTVKVGSKTLGSAKANSKGAYSVTIKVQKVGTTLSVTAKDKAGNVSKATTTKVVKP